MSYKIEYFKAHVLLIRGDILNVKYTFIINASKFTQATQITVSIRLEASPNIII